MKTIQLTPQQRKDISDRRRHTQDRRIYQRLSAVLWSDDGRTREEIAQLVGVSTRQVGQWFRIFRNKGRDRLCTSAPRTTKVIRVASDRPRSSGSSRRSPRGSSTTPSKS